jgi:hypothetical protein
MEKWTALWENTQPILAAIVLFAAGLTAIGVIASKFGVVGKIMAKLRLASCPQKAAFDQRQTHQDLKIEQVHKQLLGLAEDTTLSMGAQIAMHCAIAIQRGYFPFYERAFVQSLMDRYRERGGNHGVDLIFDKAMLLPDEPEKKRRCTDKE